MISYGDHSFFVLGMSMQLAFIQCTLTYQDCILQVPKAEVIFPEKNSTS